jgi:hypothetical protein
MRCARNGFAVFHGGCDPKAYSSGDRFRCPGCGAEIVTGFGKESRSESDVSKWRMKPITLRVFREEDHPGEKLPAYDDGCGR